MFKMEARNKFRWNKDTKSDLLNIVNKTHENNEIQWNIVAAEFKELHPNYNGKPDSLKKQCQRFKKNNECSQRFQWNDNSKRDLLSIVNEKNETGNVDWAIVASKFSLLHPNHKGSPSALRKQYQRINQTNFTSDLEIPDDVRLKFSWTPAAKTNLLTIANSEYQSNKINWSNVDIRFKETYPLYEGNSSTLRRQYFRFKDKSELNPSFMWTKKSHMDLVRLVNLINVDGYPNWTKICYTFKRYYPEYEGSKDDLRLQYEKTIETCNDDIESSINEHINDPHEWDDNLNILLSSAIGHAQHIISCQIRDGRKKILDNLAKLSVNVFKEFYKARNGVVYLGNDAVLLKHYYDIRELSNPCSYICEEDIDPLSNVDIKKLQRYASKNHTLAFAKVFKECCHNCGLLFPRSHNNSSQKMLADPINNLAMVSIISVKTSYVYTRDEKYITCLDCYKTPNWNKDYSLSNLKTNKYSIPVELHNLNEYEQNQIALCGGFYSLYKKQNLQCKIFEHRQGECNIGKKRDIDYHSVFTTYFNLDRPHQFDSSNDKINTALRWLKNHNHLFSDFLSNYETIYGYLMSCYKLRPEERILQISKGNIADLVGKDTMGLFIPSDNVKIEKNIIPDNQRFGIQHPLQENLNKLKGIINVNYSDPDLEAKRWPHLFPEGIGSWKKNTSLKQQTYVKHRLLSIDPRFRKTNEFMFFWYDRLIKERLLYYNNRCRSVNVTELVDQIQVKDVRKNTNMYGSVVPSSITGSKTYWRARCFDLLALTRDLGKPDLFVTLTQNDNWLELQEACGEISPDELDILDQPIMQPAIGGKSIVKFPVETVVAFYRRLDMFMHSCIHNKNGPFGEVIDYWYRIEYQNRGALHCHMVLWICEDTIPEDVVTAEMPRCSEPNTDIKNQTFLAREYVKTFQMHVCTFNGCRKANNKCKYGFPYGIQLSEEINESKMGFKYIRRSEEDNNVVPFNIYALLCWNGHLNVQKVTPNGIEAYLCKYVTKPERSIDLKDVTSEAEKFLKARVVGILECCAHLLQFHQVASSRKTVFLPCDFKPKQRILKRNSHLPADIESKDVYYQTLLYKYLVRPKELQNLTYVDMYRFYDVVSEKAKVVQTQNEEQSDDDSYMRSEFQPKCDETQFEFNGRIKKIKSQRISYVSCGYKYVERGKAAIPRWRFLMPFGDESEKYYEQRLLLNVPIFEEELNGEGYPFSEENKSKTFIEECCLRGLVDSEETAKSALLGAIQRGFSVERVLEIAKLFVDQSFVTNEYVDSIILPWQDSMPCVEDSHDCDNEYGEELAKMLEMRPKNESYETYHQKMTQSQKNVMEWVDQKLKNSDQILAIISGGAGVGKSFITKALYSYFVEKKMVCVLLATTGSAAYLVSGTTVHYYLKVDIHGNSFMQPGTISAKIVEDTDVIILDEFSMLSSDLLDQLNICTKEYGKSKLSPFGGKHFFLIGDPCQLPAINTSVFSNPILNLFSILMLKETVRQKDETFAALLNRVRINMMTEEDISLLKTRYTHMSNIECDDDMLIVTATRNKMQFYNHKFITQLAGKQIVVNSKDFERDTNKEVSASIKGKIQRYVKNLWDEQLVVKEGCIVRLLRNLDVPTGWVNSKRAKIFRVASDGSYIILQDITDPSKQLPLTKMRQPFKLGNNLYYRLQYPLVLGYATTVHAVQGTTVSGKYYVDLDRSFWESGQAFVALSRPKEMSQLYFLNTHFEKVYLKPYYSNLLEWMQDVDEISLMRKPRCIGDFPLIPLDEGVAAKRQIFPAVPFAEDTSHKTNLLVNADFKPPRRVKKHVTGKSNMENRVNADVPEPTVRVIGARTYRLAEAFANACQNTTIDINKIRFGIKFLNVVLEEVNDALQIHNVVDPLILIEQGNHVDHGLVKKWDEQLNSALQLFRKYCCQFRVEFDMFANILSTLDISDYSGQTLAHDVAPFYQDSKKWQPVYTAGDGRCFYHSVSTNLIGNSTLSNSLKILLSYEICREFDIYDAIFSNLGSSGASILLKALSYNCWADMEIITAMAYTLRRPIRVISGLQDSNGVQDRNYNPLESTTAPIRIAHVKMSTACAEPNHFVAMLLEKSYAQSTDEVESTIQPSEQNVLTIELPDDDVEMKDSYDSLTESL